MTKITKISLFFVFLLGSVLAPGTNAQSFREYYPLHVGDYWIQHSDSSFNEYNPKTFRKEVAGTDLIRGTDYFRITQKLTSDTNPKEQNGWVMWSRHDVNGFLMGAFGDSSLFYDLTVPTRVITVDGDSSDWNGIAAQIQDPQGDDSVNYTGDDIKAFYIAKDANNLYLRMDLWDNVNISFQNMQPPYDGKYVFRIEGDTSFGYLDLGVVYDQYNNRWSLGHNGSNNSAPTALTGPSFVGVNGSIIELRLPWSIIGTPTRFNEIAGEVYAGYYDFTRMLDQVRAKPTTIFDPPLPWISAAFSQVGDRSETNAPAMGGRFIFIMESVTETVQVPAGTFANCIKFRQYVIASNGDTTQKMQVYCAPGVGEVLKKGWDMETGNTKFELVDYFVQTVQIDHDKNVQAGDTLSITALPSQQGFQPTVSRLYYRPAGQKRWQYRNLQYTGTNFRGIIPPDSVTYRGLEYYFYLSNGRETVTYPEFQPETNPAIIQVAVQQVEAPIRIPEMAFKMISVPISLTDPRIFQVLFDDYGEFDSKKWRLFRWENGNYAEHPNIEANFAPGTSFWLISRNGEPFDVDNGLSMNSAESYQLILQPGWNQIANPFPFPVVTDSVIVPTGTLDTPVYFDGTQYRYDVAVLEPWEGYFVFNRTDRPITITIPPRAAAAGNLPKFAAKGQIDPKNEYQLQLSAQVPGTSLIDNQNYLGFRQDAEPGLDHLDFAEAPPIGDYLQVSIIEAGERFAGSFKPVTDQGQSWMLELGTTNRKAREAQLWMSAEGQLPPGFQIYILDQDYLCPIPIQGQKLSIDLNNDYPERSLKILIGTEEFAASHNDGISLTPIAYRLAQNYPNPFNPSTHIQYQIGRRGRVELDIYNMLGQKVRSLVHEIQNPGLYTTLWDGKDDFGGTVASGIYCYRIQAGDFISSQKLVLLR